jgi:hypothetical protein
MIGAIKLSSSFIGMAMLNYFGRKSLMIAGNIFETISMIGLGISLQLNL